MSRSTVQNCERKSASGEGRDDHGLMAEQLHAVASHMRQPTGGTVQVMQTVEYISEMCESMLELVRGREFMMLQHLLGMVKLECDSMIAKTR